MSQRADISIERIGLRPTIDVVQIEAMNTMLPVVFTAELQRKDPRLPVYVVVPCVCVAHWQLEATAMVEGTINGHEFGRRSIKRMSSTSHSDWFVEYTAPICKAAGVSVGDALNVSLHLARTGNPGELEALLASCPEARASWSSLSEYTRRTWAEHIRAGKTQATRLRRAQAIVRKLTAEHGSLVQRSSQTLCSGISPGSAQPKT